MELKEKLTLHNRFDIKVCDAETGEVKQTAVAYNVITNQFFRARLGYIEGRYGKIMEEPLNRILVGTGSGTPAITDTAMFNELLVRECTVVEENYAYQI